jgi:hypothetical protein
VILCSTKVNHGEAKRKKKKTNKQTTTSRTIVEKFASIVLLGGLEVLLDAGRLGERDGDVGRRLLVALAVPRHEAADLRLVALVHVELDLLLAANLERTRQRVPSSEEDSKEIIKNE